MIKQISLTQCLTVIVLIGCTTTVIAHDPIFGLGPHVIYKDGIEIAPEFHIDKKGAERESEFALELTYGITGDWAAGIEIPYTWQDDGINNTHSRADLKLFSKYRFWRNDLPSLQESAAVLLKIKTNTADKAAGIDTILGLTYGSEGRTWYHWASLRYRINGEDDNSLKRGNKLLLDFVIGIRPILSTYLEPDTVWLLELNGEYTQRAKLNGTTLNNSGGREWFLSPGIFWTQRNFAIKAGIQIPIINRLNGMQDKTDYRGKLVFEWHI